MCAVHKIVVLVCDIVMPQKSGSDSELCPKIENQKSCKLEKLMLKLTKEAIGEVPQGALNKIFLNQGFSKKKLNTLLGFLMPKPPWSSDISLHTTFTEKLELPITLLKA